MSSVKTSTIKDRIKQKTNVEYNNILIKQFNESGSLIIGIAISSLAVNNTLKNELKKIISESVPNWFGSYVRVSTGVTIAITKKASIFLNNKFLTVLNMFKLILHSPKIADC